MPRPLILDDITDLRRRAATPWGRPIAQAILAEAAGFKPYSDDDLRDWPTADLVPRWAWDERSDQLERIGQNRNAFIVAMGSVRRSQRIRRELLTMAAAAALDPANVALREACLRIWRAPLHWQRWQYPGWTLYYKEHSMPADGDGEWGATENYLVTLPLCAEFLAEWLTADDWRLLHRRVAEFCSRIEDDFYVGRSWFFAHGGRPEGNQFTQIIGGLGVGALSLLGHDPRAPRWVELATEQMLRSMDATGHDGSYFEGAAYGLGTMEQVWMLAHLLERQGDARLIQHPQVRNFPYWLMDTMLPDYDHWLPLNDGDGSLRQEALFNRRRNWAGAVLALAVRRTQDPALNWFLHEVVGGPSHDVFGLLYYDPSAPLQRPTAQERLIRMAPDAGWLAALPPDRGIPYGQETEASGLDRLAVHYPSQGIVIVRTGFGTDDVVLVLKGGWSVRGHDHVDRNSVLLYDGPHPIITEAGPGPYHDPLFDEHFGSYHAHSTLQLDRSIVPHASLGAGVEGVERLPDGSLRLVGEAAASYPALRRFRRTLWARLPHRVQITDEVVPQDGAAHEVAFWFHTPRTARLEGETIRIPGQRGDWILRLQQGQLAWAEEPLGGEGAETRTAFVARGTLPAGGAVYHFLLEQL